MPTKCSSRDKIILWSTVSKDEVNSYRFIITELVANKVSLRTRNKADSVLRRGLKPDWKDSTIWFALRKDWSWINTVFSSALVMNRRYEIGRKWFASSEGYLRRGVTVASLWLSGIVPETKKFRKDTNLGPTESNFCFKIRGGRTSWEQKGFKWLIISCRVWRETGSKALHMAEEQHNSGETLASDCNWDLRVVILSQKYLEKASHIDTEGFKITFTGGFKIEFITEIRL